ncbi:MAG: TrmH family RNA methyltransferase [Candidatus Bipolaricaulaceae bacterium]
MSRVVTEWRRRRIDQVVQARLAGLAVVCENLHNPHNAAAILRTCEALGVLNVYVVEEDRPFSPARGVTQGAEKWVRVHRFRRVERALGAIAQAGYALYAAVPGEGGLCPEELPCAQPLALAFGAEDAGLSDQLMAAAAGTFHIPMWGFTQSLNVSVAAAIAVYVCGQARRRGLGDRGDLDPAEAASLRGRYRDLSIPARGRPQEAG